MGKKSDLSNLEKRDIGRMLLNEKSTLDISKILQRDHRTIKKHLHDTTVMRKRRDRFKFRSITQKDVFQLKRSTSKMPLSTSKKIFCESNLGHICKSTRNRILGVIAKVRTAKKRPPLSSLNKAKRLTWAKKNMKVNFNDVMFTDECRATLDGPDGFSRGWLPG